MRYLIIVLVLAVLSIGAVDDVAVKIQNLTNRIEVLESYLPQQLVVSGQFTGQGNTQTHPFTVNHSPWLIKWETHIPRKARTTFTIFVSSNQTTVKGYGFRISENTTTGQTYSYLPAGTYHLRIDTGGYVSWGIDVD